MMVWWLKG